VGDLKEPKFLAYYFWNNKVVAATSMNMPNSASIIQEALLQNVMPNAEAIKRDPNSLEEIKKKIFA